MLAYIEILRPRQWYKNLLLLVGIVFSKKLGEPDLLLHAVLGFAVFCLLSGAIYILNDIVDKDRDLAHPRKSRRPIPSGRISVWSAGPYGAVLATCGLLLATVVGRSFLAVSLVYVLVAVSYSFFIKNLVIVDALFLAAGFVIRAYAGTVAVDVPISPWLIICVFLLSLFLTFGKRRQELAVLGKEAENHRQILKHYSVHMVENMMSVSTSTLIMAYTMYTFLATSRYMMLTIPFAVYGLLRYLLLVHAAGEGAEPEHIFKDIPSAINFVAWALIVLAVLYVAPETAHLIG